MSAAGAGRSVGLSVPAILSFVYFLAFFSGIEDVENVDLQQHCWGDVCWTPFIDFWWARFRFHLFSQGSFRKSTVGLLTVQRLPHRWSVTSFICHKLWRVRVLLSVLLKLVSPSYPRASSPEHLNIECNLIMEWQLQECSERSKTCLVSQRRAGCLMKRGERQEELCPARGY